MKNEEMTFKVLNDEGKEIECEVLLTFESEETGKNYIVYTDNSIDEDGNTKVFASIERGCLRGIMISADSIQYRNRHHISNPNRAK